MFCLSRPVAILPSIVGSVGAGLTSRMCSLTTHHPFKMFSSFYFLVHHHATVFLGGSVRSGGQPIHYIFDSAVVSAIDFTLDGNAAAARRLDLIHAIVHSLWPTDGASIHTTPSGFGVVVVQWRQQHCGIFQNHSRGHRSINYNIV